MLNNIKQDAQQRMAKSVDALKHELQRLRTGRASTARARLISCFCPTESKFPPSPTSSSNPLGKRMMKSYAPTSWAAAR